MSLFSARVLQSLKIIKHFLLQQIFHNNNIIIERDDTPPPPPYSSVISEIIHGGIVATNTCTGHVYTESHDGYCYTCRI